MSRHRRSWLIFSAFAAAVVLALAWVSLLVLRLERAELRARAEAEHQESLRLALWRMDSRVAPLLARESSRPYVEYRPYYQPERARSRGYRPLPSGEVLAPSPLLTFDSGYIRLHFELADGQSPTSPQAPMGVESRLAVEDGLSDFAQLSNQITLDDIAPRLDLAGLRERVPLTEEELLARFRPDAAPPDGRDGTLDWLSEPQRVRNQVEFEQRAECSDMSAVPDGAYDAQAAVGPLVPLWLAHGDEVDGALLLFVRQVRIQGGDVFQGFVADWEAMRASLLEQVDSLFPEARLRPVLAADDPAAVGHRLATIPAVLEVPAVAPVAASLATPARVTLAVAWLAVLLGLAAVGVTLHASIDFGERRSRFVSAVTHELRTPLTTFRMYSDMLATGMVRDERKAREYLETLRSESERLSTLVENVLAYAGLEAGRTARRSERLTVDALLERVAPALRRRVEEAGATLEIASRLPPGRTVDADVDGVGQILFNLVDNACKYAGGPGEGTVTVEASEESGALMLRVRDAGPGVPPEHAAAIFHPFERGARAAGDIPGVGLGLALSRGLARRMGGDLTLETPAEGGASFRLTVP